MSTQSKLLPLLAVLAGVGCSDAVPSTAPRAIEPSSSVDDRAPRTLERFVAIGTSVTMGWASNGVYAGSQITSFPALLGFGSLRPISLPLIQSPGCTSPIVAPIGAGKRLSGESISGSTTCAPLVNGITLPTQNLGLAGAITADALLATPESKGASAPWYGRVLPPGMTQVTAALSQQPTIVSLELGANDILNATSGLFAPGSTVVPFPNFAAPFNAILDALGAAQTKVVVAGLPADGRNLAAMRRGSEIWANRAEFAALNVNVSDNCENNENYINVSLKSLDMVFTAAFTSTHGLPNPTYSCADIPGTVDYILTPTDMAAVNALLAQMTAHIKSQATARGYAYYSLGALFDRSDLKGGAYSVVTQMTSKFPYGLYTSLDGVHPNGIGSAVIATAAAFAINAKYGRDGVGSAPLASVLPSAPSIALADRLEEPASPLAMMQAKRIAAENAGRKMTVCATPMGGC